MADYPDQEAAEPREEPAGTDSNVAILPMSFFPSDKKVKPGDVCEVKVTSVRDDSVLVSYSGSEEYEIDEEVSDLMR